MPVTTSCEAAISKICQDHNNDTSRLIDILRSVQDQFEQVSDDAIDCIAGQLGCPRVEVHSAASFYEFLSERRTGHVVIRLCNDIVDDMKGGKEVAEAFRSELGIDFGQTTPDGSIGLEHAPCIGMCDQSPAALINDVVVTNLGTDQARTIVRRLKADPNPAKLITRFGDGNNAHDLVRSMVQNNVRLAGEVVFEEMERGVGLRNAIAMTPVEVINDIKTSRLRGRGGAGFPTGMKWEFTRAAEGSDKYILCNADEGEPGTFKDRVLLTERPNLVFEGMAIAGYAIGAKHGVLYLRGEYAYLRAFLESVLKEQREAGLLGNSILGVVGFDFDIRIQMGAGAYVCGEETALISSCEGKRGDPKNRPPFPAQKGYLGCPTTVNNVETFCNVARILEKGPGWFAMRGSAGSKGTKLLSISGDCAKPGVYEVPFGTALASVLKLCGAQDVGAVQVGGPSGRLVGPDEFSRPICYDHLATGGAIVVFDTSRNVLEIASKYLEFFVEESCGYCTPCRVGNVLMKERIDAILAGKGQPSDLEYLERLATSVKAASRCGLGQTSPNPVVSTLKSFRSQYEALIKPPHGEFLPTFDIKAAIGKAEELAGRGTVYSWE